MLTNLEQLAVIDWIVVGVRLLIPGLVYLFLRIRSKLTIFQSIAFTFLLAVLHNTIVSFFIQDFSTFEKSVSLLPIALATSTLLFQRYVRKQTLNKALVHALIVWAVFGLGYIVVMLALFWFFFSALSS